VAVFFINTQDGRVAARRQLVDAGETDDQNDPPRPWHPIQGPPDASTMWYAVLRKQERGIFIGTLCIRHTGRQASMERAGWEEVPPEAIGITAASAPSES
jgi:hypothetical protein